MLFRMATPDRYVRTVEQVRFFSRYWGYYYRELARMLGGIIPADVSLAQLGAENGHLLSLLTAAEKTAIESDEALLEEGRRLRQDIRFLKADFWNLAAPQTYEYVLLAEVTDSMRDVDVVLTGLRDLLNPEGRLVIVTRSSWWRPLFALAKRLPLIKTQPRFKGLLRLRDMHNMLRISGFEVVHYGRGVLCPVYIPLISWFLNRVLARVAPFQWFGAAQYIVARPVRVVAREASVSVIIAARNERGNIERLVERVPEFGKELELVFVEGNSRDGTWDEIVRVQKAYEGRRRIVALQQEGRGKWDAVKKGFSIATGELLMILDADMTVPPEDLPRFYRVFAEGHGDFINGSRMIYPMESRAMRFFNKLGNRFFAMFVGLIIRTKLSDTLCGTKVFRRSEWERMQRLPEAGRDPFGDFEMLFGAHRLNLSIVELPVRYRDREYGETQINRWRDGWLLLKLCIHTWKSLRFTL